MCLKVVKSSFYINGGESMFLRCRSRRGNMRILLVMMVLCMMLAIFSKEWRSPILAVFLIKPLARSCIQCRLSRQWWLSKCGDTLALLAPSRSFSASFDRDLLNLLHDAALRCHVTAAITFHNVFYGLLMLLSREGNEQLSFTSCLYLYWLSSPPLGRIISTKYFDRRRSISTRQP